MRRSTARARRARRRRTTGVGGQGWIPDHSRVPWKMAFMAGHNTGNWRAAGTRFPRTVLAKLDTIVALTPDMSVTAMLRRLRAADRAPLRAPGHGDGGPHALHPGTRRRGAALPRRRVGRRLEAMSRIAMKRQRHRPPRATRLPPTGRDLGQARRARLQASPAGTMDGQVTRSRDIVAVPAATTPPASPRSALRATGAKGFVIADDSAGTAVRRRARVQLTDPSASVRDDKLPYRR